MNRYVAACIVVCGVGSGCSETNDPTKTTAAEPAKSAANSTKTTLESVKVIAEPKRITTEVKKITVDLGGGVKMEMTLIPAGEFMMGSGESAEDTTAFFQKNYPGMLVLASGLKDEHPQHRVRITRPFYLGKYHVTRGQFRQFVTATQYKTDSETAKKPGAVGWDFPGRVERIKPKYSWRDAGFEQTDEHPVVNVSWNDALAFCKWLSNKDGKTYRLPTEAEWEYACRASTTTRYYSGDDPETLVNVGNVGDVSFAMESLSNPGCLKASDGYPFTSPVGRFKPNAFGLYDMHGNAYQWCMDWYNEKYYATSPRDDPPGPESGTYRVLRGGSWYDAPIKARSNDRYFRTPDEPTFHVGFRVARTE